MSRNAPTADKPLELAIDFGEGKAGYGTVHKRGCRDLADPENIGAATTKREAAIAADAVTYWNTDEGLEPGEFHYVFAPCCKSLLA